MKPRTRYQTFIGSITYTSARDRQLEPVETDAGGHHREVGFAALAENRPDQCQWRNISETAMAIGRGGLMRTRHRCTEPT